MQHLFITLATFMLLLMPSTGMAKNNASLVKIATYEIPLLVKNSENGVFIDIIREAAKRAELTPDIRVYPPKRAMKLFINKRVDALLPALDMSLKRKVSKTIPIHIKRLFAFVMGKDNLPKRTEDLEGSRVGLITGFSYPDSILANPKIRKDWASSVRANLLKLKQGRINVFIGDPDIILEQVTQGGFEGIYYNFNYPISKEPAFVAFQPTQKGKMFREKFNRALRSMQKDGTTAQLKSPLMQFVRPYGI